ncbi:MAG TPA: DUF58 domain-containing protein [Candidatus Polarisedimenticolia bacterium]|jgi:uncharacterized protein (DUF58 family)|nr:DUF58 domain-containing protein [Candidatus Polarisedimenticolia bacterium]
MLPAEILRKVRRIEIRTNRLVNESLAGEYHSVFKGRGMEFSEVREYQFGDDIRNIDWNVTSRMGHPYVKKHVEERELTVMLLVDFSGSGEFGTRRQFKREIAAEICALLAFSAIKNSDRVGLVAFTDRIEKFLRPRKGKDHVLRVIREVLYFRPEGRATDLAQALQFLYRTITKRAVVFVVSDFLAEGYEQPLRVAARKHDVIAVTITDPREEDLPPIGLIDLEDAETGERVLVNASDRQTRERFRTWAAGRRAARAALFRANAIDALELFTDRSYDAPLVRFFHRRARRMSR